MYKFAVIGRNFIADWFLEAASEIPEISLLGIYSRKEETAREYAEKKGAERIYTEIDELCNDSDIDFVYIASPNICHEEQAIKLLNSGKHVLCEKPAALSSKSFGKILSAAKKSVFMEGMVPLHMPGYKKICELLPKIGAVRHIDFNFCQYSSRYDRYKNGIITNTFDPTLGNGALTDLGIYCIEMLVSLFGMPDDIIGKAVFSGIDVIDSLICEYPDKTAKINISKISDGAVPSQIQGENGCILIDKISRPKIITFCPRGEEKTVYDTTEKKHDMSYEIKAFISAVNSGTADNFNETTNLAMHFLDSAVKKLGITFKKC